MADIHSQLKNEISGLQKQRVRQEELITQEKAASSTMSLLVRQKEGETETLLRDLRATKGALELATRS